MRTTTLEVMHDQIRAIYRAATGSDMSEPQGAVGDQPVAEDEVERRFADLEAAARSIPEVARRVPPFSFTPPIDAIEDESELLIEVAAPGVERDDVEVEWSDNMLTISGLRRGERVSTGRSFYCAEIPRGPFRRTVSLPYAITGAPRVHVEAGMIFVHVEKPREIAEPEPEPEPEPKPKPKTKAKAKAKA